MHSAKMKINITFRADQSIKELLELTHKQQLARFFNRINLPAFFIRLNLLRAMNDRICACRIAAVAEGVVK